MGEVALVQDQDGGLKAELKTCVVEPGFKTMHAVCTGDDNDKTSDFINGFAKSTILPSVARSGEALLCSKLSGPVANLTSIEALDAALSALTKVEHALAKLI